MDPLENIVRFRLSKISNDSFLDYMKRHPQYEVLYTSALEMNSNELEKVLEIHSPKTKNPDEKLLLDYLNDGLLLGFNEILCFENMVNSHGTEYMKSLSHIQRSSDKDRRERLEFKKFLESHGSEPLTFDKMERAEADYENYFIPLENYVVAIKDSVHKIGIEKVLRDENRFSVIREIYGDPESYDTCEKNKNSYKLDTFRNSIEAFDIIGNAMDKTKEEGKLLYDSNEVLKCFMGGVENLFNIMNELSKDYTKEKIERIYKKQ